MAVVALMASATAQVGPQPVRLADGDSFSLGHDRYRLYGIDAPELHQQCTDASGEAWPCGLRARSELRRIIGTSPVQCRTVSTDRYGRFVAICRAGGRDIASELVRAGFATTIKSRDGRNPYEDEEADARAEKRGLWAGTFEPPREWRRANPRRPETAPLPESPRDWLARKTADLWQVVSDWVRWLLGH